MNNKTDKNEIIVPKSQTLKKRAWSEVNQLKKECRKKWKESNLEKKLQNEKIIEIKEASSNSTSSSSEISTNFVSTLSLAVPGSLLENAQTRELRTYLAGQIARACCIFQVDEIIVFDDYAEEVGAKKAKYQDNISKVNETRQSCLQLGRILQYLECPQYLRKSFFPIHEDLRFCGLLNPLNTPHHLTAKENFIFREGVVLNTPDKSGKGSIINVGLLKQVKVDKALTAGIRCTVKLLPQESNLKKLKGIIVSPTQPRIETGIYWGYTVRMANSLSKVLSQCPYRDGYDLTIGTSDKGCSVDEFKCTKFKHLLMVFGGVHGLEVALENDPLLDTDDPKLLFDHYLNTVPNQGSKTVRTEEALLISLAALRPKLNPEFPNKIYNSDQCDNTNIIL